MPPYYEIMPTTSGKWLLVRTMEGSPVVAEFANKQDAQRALLLFEKSEQQPKSLVDSEQARQEFDRVWSQAHSKKNNRPGTVSGYDHQLDG